MGNGHKHWSLVLTCLNGYTGSELLMIQWKQDIQLTSIQQGGSWKTQHVLRIKMLMRITWWNNSERTETWDDFRRWKPLGCACVGRRHVLVDTDQCDLSDLWPPCVHLWPQLTSHPPPPREVGFRWRNDFYSIDILTDSYHQPQLFITSFTEKKTWSFRLQT